MGKQKKKGKKKKKAPEVPPNPAEVAALEKARAFAARVRAIELQNPYGYSRETALDSYRSGQRPDPPPGLRSAWGSPFPSSPHEQSEEEDEENKDNEDNEGDEDDEDDKDDEDDENDEGNTEDEQRHVWNGAGAAERQRLGRLHLLGPRYDVDRRRREARDKIVKNIYTVRALRDFKGVRANLHKEEPDPLDRPEPLLGRPLLTPKKGHISRSTPLLSPLREALGRPSTSPSARHSSSYSNFRLSPHPRSGQKADSRAVLGPASASVKKCSLAPSGRSALFSGGDPARGGGMLALLRSPHLDRGEVRALHLNGFNAGVGLRSLPECQFRPHDVQETHSDDPASMLPSDNSVFRNESVQPPGVAVDGDLRSSGSESVLSRNDKGILMQIMSKCRRLRTLEVAGLKACVRNESVRQLGMCPHLKTVDISGANVSPHALLEGLNRCPMIAHLILRSCPSLFDDGTNGIGAGALFLRALLRKKSLRLVNLSENATLTDHIIVEAIPVMPGQEGEDEVAVRVAVAGEKREEALPKKSPGVQVVASCDWTHLNLSRCPRIGDAGLGLLLPSCPKLCELKLSGCDQASLTDRTFESLGTSCVAERKRYLKKLDISGLNQLRAGAGLLSMLRNCTNLEVLSISGLGLEGNLNSACLTAITLLPRLDSLDVSGSSRFISTKFLYALVVRNGDVGEHQGLSGSIRVLNVTGCRCVNEGVIRSLKKCKDRLTVVWSPPVPPRLKPLAPLVGFQVAARGRKTGNKKGKKKKKKKKKKVKKKGKKKKKKK